MRSSPLQFSLDALSVFPADRLLARFPADEASWAGGARNDHQRRGFWAGEEQLTRDRAVAVEQSLARTGPAGVDQKSLERVLGRREDLATARDRRRYDQLAGRVAVGDVVRSLYDSSDRWVQTVPLPDRGDALWQQDRGLGLSPAQQRVIKRQEEVDRNQDRGGDLGR